MTDSGSGKKGTESTVNTIMNFVQKFILPFAIVFLTWQHNYISKLDDRLNTLEKEAVTQQMLSMEVRRTQAYIDVRFDDFAKRQEAANEMLKMLVDQKANRR